MTRLGRTIAAGVVAVALAGVPAGCGEDDVERGAEDAEQGVRDAGREAQDEGGEIKKDVEKEIED